METYVVELLQKLEAGITKYAPVAWQAMLQVKRIDSIQEILTAGVFFVLSIIGVRYGIKMVARGVQADRDHEDVNAEMGYKMGGGFLTIASGVALIISVVCLCNVWTWVGVFNPQLAVIHDLYVKAVSVVSK